MSRSKKDEKLMKRGEIPTGLHIGSSKELIKLRKNNAFPREKSTQLGDIEIENCPNLMRVLRSYPNSTVMDFGGIPLLNIHLN